MPMANARTTLVQPAGEGQEQPKYPVRGNEKIRRFHVSKWSER